jgi:predicted nucleic acid-binding protein
MVQTIYLDTGIITLFYTQSSPHEIANLMEEIKLWKITAYINWLTLVEAFNNLCIAKGKNFAESTIVSFLNTYPIKLLESNQSLIIKAGLLKCQYRTKLSYIDCLMIAHSVNQKLIVHTTEKDLPKIPSLLIKKYKFQ